MIFKILAVESQLSSSKVEHSKTVTAESALNPVESQNINLLLCITKVVKQLQEIITEYFRSHVFPIQVSKNEKKKKILPLKVLCFYEKNCPFKQRIINLKCGLPVSNILTSKTIGSVHTF